MVNTNKSDPVRLKWYKNQIEDFKKENPNKTFSLLLWNEDEFEIAEQLLTALQEDVDHILTEIIPENLPTICSIKEYNFLNERFEVLKSSTTEEIEKAKASIGRKLIIDKEFEATYFKISVIKDEINKLFDSVITINEIIESESYIKHYDCEEIFIFVINPFHHQLSIDIFKSFEGNKYLFVDFNNQKINFQTENIYKIINIDKEISIRHIFHKLMKPDSFIVKNKSANCSDNLNINFSFTKEVIYESGKFIKNISINPFKQNYFLTNFNNKTIDSHCFLIEFSQLLSNTSLLESTENTHTFLNVLLYHKPQELLKLKNIDILVSKIISAVHRKSNDSDIALARQLLNGFDSMSAKNITTFDIELYNFILCHPQINREFVNKYLGYIKDNFNNIKARRFLVKYLSYHFEFNDFVLICESDLFEINELFQIVVKRFGLNLLNINEYLNQKEFIDWINLLKNKDESFFEANYSNTLSLLKIIISDHLNTAFFNEKANSLSAIDKILVNSYSIVNDLDVTYNANDIISTLGDEKEDSFGKNIHDFIVSNSHVSNNQLLDFLLDASHYHDVILILYIANLNSLPKTIHRCYRILKNYVPEADELVSFITQN